MFICVRYFSEPEKEVVLETLRMFINPLISILDRKIVSFSYSLSHDYYDLKDVLDPHYEFAHFNISANRDCKWIKETIDKYNVLVNALNANNIGDRKLNVEEWIMRGQLETGKELAIELNSILSKIKRNLIKKANLTEGEIQKDEKQVGANV